MGDTRTSIQNALQGRYSGSLRVLAQDLNCGVSHTTVGRIMAGNSVSAVSLRRVARALGVPLPQRASWERRARLRAECAARGVTVEDAAEMWLAGQ